MRKKNADTKKADAIDPGLVDLLRESHAQRQVIVELSNEFVALARQHAGLLRDSVEASARHRRTAEILEHYRLGAAEHIDLLADRVEGKDGEPATPSGSMRFTVDKGWHRVEGGE